MKKQTLIDNINVKRIGTGCYRWTYRKQTATYTRENHDSVAYDAFTEGEMTLDELVQLRNQIVNYGVRE
jgi:hypothetical protein